MIERIRYALAQDTLPYANLALEEYLLETVAPGECILYLWQNRQTVVIGRNQNAWKECKTSELEDDGGFLVRRLSGGGAVFHDLGNLNFTFLVHEADYDVGRQLDVILQGVKKLGIAAEKTGRNDITADGRKFSGNAFYQAGSRCYHHGTVLVSVDMGNLSRYLTVSPDKLKSKGVDSVRARVGNLTDFQPGLTISAVRDALIAAFEEVYSQKAVQITAQEIDEARVAALTEKYRSWEWNFGKKLAFEVELSRRFDWGDIQLQMKLDSGRVEAVQVYSDAMDFVFMQILPTVLYGVPFSAKALSDAVLSLPAQDAAVREMQADIGALLLEAVSQL